MREMQELRAEPRSGTGKGAARAVRRNGQVPGILYGGKGDNKPIQIDALTLLKHYGTGTLLSTLFMLDVGGEKARVIPRGIEIDPVSDRPIHVDFMRLEPGTRIALHIPVHFKNHAESPGIKLGGVLNVVRHTVELHCPAENIPEFIEGDLAGLEIGDSLHISAFKLPEGVRPVIQGRDFTVATVAPPTTYVEEEVKPAEGEAVAEGAEGAVPAEGAEGAAVEGAEGATPEKGKGAADKGKPGEKEKK